MLTISRSKSISVFTLAGFLAALLFGTLSASQSLSESDFTPPALAAISLWLLFFALFGLTHYHLTRIGSLKAIVVNLALTLYTAMYPFVTTVSSFLPLILILAVSTPILAVSTASYLSTYGRRFPLFLAPFTLWTFFSPLIVIDLLLR